MRCPRCKAEIKTAEDLRKHVLCEVCREEMLNSRWFEENGYMVLAKFSRMWESIVHLFDQRIKEKQQALEENFKEFIAQGFVENKYTNKILHDNFEWHGAGRVTLRDKKAEAY